MICGLLFKFVFWHLICDRQASCLWSPFKTSFYLVPPIVFSFRAEAYFYLGTICRFSWNGTYVSHWRFHDNRHMNTSAGVSKFKIVPIHVKCWILIKPVLRAVDGSLHLTVSSMNRLNQTESATFSILPCCAFFKDSYFLYFILFRDTTNDFVILVQ
jgi:hypothetical protein